MSGATQQVWRTPVYLSTQPVPIPVLEGEEFFLQLLFPGPS